VRCIASHDRRMGLRDSEIQESPPCRHALTRVGVTGLEAQALELVGLLEGVIHRRSNEPVMLMGRSGCGKNYTLDYALAVLRQR
jgi:hypothetical protein